MQKIFKRPLYFFVQFVYNYNVNLKIVEFCDFLKINEAFDMKEKQTKSYFGRVASFMLALSMMLCLFHGCGDDDSSGTLPPEKSSVEQEASGDVSSENTTDGSSQTLSGNENEKTSSDDKTDKSDGGSGKATSSSKTTKSGATKGTGTTKKSGTTKKATTTKKTTTTQKVTTTKSNTYYAPKVYSNSAPGTLTFASSDGSAVVDYSNTSSGYIMVKYSGAYSNIRVVVTAPNGTAPPYPIFTRNTWEALPLTYGNGTYTVTVFGNNGGTSYYQIVKQEINVSLSYSTVAYIRPNVICNYNSSTACVQYAAQLTRGCDNDVDKVEAIYKYVVKNFSYDNAKASSVSSSAYVPDLASVWSSKKGICYDYAATMAAMLRTQGIPTKVVAGYVNGQYHAWISTWIKGSGWIDNIIYFDGNSWKLMDPTFASTGGIGTDWSKKYSYSVRYTY